MQKTVLTAQGLLEDSLRLGVQVLDSGFRPTMIIAIWRGGTPVGMAVQEELSFAGVGSGHIALRPASYTGVDERDSKVAIFGLDYIINKVTPEDRVLIVDDVFDTGNTVVAVIEELRRRARDNMADDVRVAVPWFKPARNQTDIVPDYFVQETDEWLVFPHELDALDADELRQARPALANVIEQARTARQSSQDQ